MNICEFFSYKTFYYFLKDISCLDLRNYKLCEDEFNKGRTYKPEDIEGLFEDGRLGTDDLILIKTKYGYFCYHKVDDIEYVKEFLKTNSKVARCGVFGSYRTSDVYLMGVARSGEIDRLLYNEDGNDPVIEGEPTQFEKDNNLFVSEDDFSSQVKFFNEENVFSYAKWLAGFDIENEDVEILEVLYYVRVPFSSEIEGNMVQNIYAAFGQHRIKDIPIMIGYNREENQVVIACENVKKSGKRNVIYCDVVYGVDNKQEFLASLKRCFNAIFTLDLNDSSGTLYDISCYYNQLKNRKCNMACYIIDVERKFMNSITLFQKKGRIVKQNAWNMFLYGKIHYTLNSAVLEDIYNKCKVILRVR